MLQNIRPYRHKWEIKDRMVDNCSRNISMGKQNQHISCIRPWLSPSFHLERVSFQRAYTYTVTKDVFHTIRNSPFRNIPPRFKEISAFSFLISILFQMDINGVTDGHPTVSASAKRSGVEEDRRKSKFYS